MLKNLFKKNKLLIKNLNLDINSLIPYIVIFIFIPNIIYGFLRPLNPDIYNNLYFSSRLLEGELLWTKEFHDKFPFIQYFFLLPAYFKSVNIWKIQSFLFHTLASILFYKSAYIFLETYWKRVKKHSIEVVKYITIIYFISPFYLMGFSHFSSTSVSLISISISTLFIYLKNGKLNNIFKSWQSWIALITLSMAISIRPYFLPIAISIGLWVPIRTIYLKQDRFKVKHTINFFLIWNTLLFLITFILNFLPYLITNNISVIFDGIILNSQDINPQSILDIISQQSKIFYKYEINFLILILITITIYLFFEVLQKGLTKIYLKNYLLSPDLFFIGFLFPLLLETLILSKHYWNHYSLMFLPFVSFLALTIVSIFVEKILSNNNNNINFKNFVGIFLFTILFFQSFIISIKLIAYKSKSRFNDSDLNGFAHELSEYSISKFNELDFIDFTNQQLHIKLNHGRKGFPHPPHIKHLQRNWYLNKNIYVPSKFKTSFPLNTDSLFKYLIKTKTRIVIVNKNSNLNKLIDNSKIYQQNQILTKSLNNTFNKDAKVYEIFLMN